MDPLVEQLKKATEQETEGRNSQAALRLHNAGIIRAKAPVFWQIVQDAIEGICMELRQEFPSDNRYHLSLEKQPSSGFFLHGGKLPRCILSADLDVIGQQVLLSERILQAREHQPMPKFKAPITITVGTEEELIFKFDGKCFDTPHDLARAIIGYVIRFSKITITCSVAAWQ